MNKENLKKSYMLIGPAGVGKSLIAENLSKKTGLPVFSIDEIIEFAKDRYRSGFPKFFLNKNKLFKHYKDFALDYGPEYEPGSEFDKKQNEMLNELAELFFYYEKELKSFRAVKNAYLKMYKLDKQFEFEPSPLISSYIFQKLTIDVYKIILNKINKPVIFDMPCNFAWFLPKDEVFEENYIDHQALNHEMEKILNNVGSSILIELGQDFEKRSPREFYFEYILNNFKNYKKSDIIISTNDLFYNPDDKLLRIRDCFNSEARLKNEELLNKAELNNICDQIIEMSSNLNQYS